MILTIFTFLVLLSVLVLAHEWGHYFTAKKIGAKVEEFGLGFPPRIFAWKGKKGMLWSINWIPIGGFVRIKGESGEDRQDENSFGYKSIPARAIVLFAGVFMNLVLAAVLLSIGYLAGTPAVTEGEVSKFASISDRAITITQVLPDSPADLTGIEPGDEVVSINGVVYEYGEEARDALAVEDETKIVSMQVWRNGETLDLELTPAYVEEIERFGIGVAILETGIVRYPIYIAPVKGVETTVYFTKEIVVAFYNIIKGLVVGQGPGVEISGPVGIAVITGEVAQMGIIYLIQFAAILSVNLAIINILPFPALDGGRIAFLAYEAIRRKPASPKFEAIVHNIGFIILILLVVLVTYKDIIGLL
ncbi:MAG: RIP metalloprotease RseP [Patescibacteria group bacterium]